MASKSAPKQDGIVAAIVLAVSNSRLKIKADRETLNSVISGQYQELVKDGALRLQVLWDLLKDLPGFDKEDAKSAFCALDSWTTDLVMKVELPKELQSMSAPDRSLAAARCSVTDAKKKQALFPGSELLETGRKQTAPGSQDTPKHATGGGGGTKRLIKILVAVALVAGGITAYSILSGGKNEVAVSTISDALPIDSATRSGTQLDLKLKSDDWFREPDSERRADMDATLRSVAAIEIDTVIVYDSTGNLRASAVWFGTPPSVRVRLKD